MTEVLNNKELVPLGIYTQRYKECDPLDMAEKTGFKWDQARGKFEITFLGKEYEVSWPVFDICGKPPEAGSLLINNKTRLLILRHLTEGSFAVSTGKYLPFKSFPGAQVYERQFYDRCIRRLAFTWGGKAEEFTRLMKEAGASETGMSEAGFQIELFPLFHVQFLLWSGDEEFPPSGQILFSDNFAAGFHPEDLVVAAEIILDLLSRKRKNAQ